MNVQKITLMMGLLLMCTLALAGAVSAIPANITRVEIDGHKIGINQTNRLDINRDAKTSIDVFLEAAEDIDNAEIQAFVSGFEHNDRLRLADSTGPFDMDANVTYRKHLYITFPDLVEEDNYKLRIILTDRDNEQLIQNYNIRIDPQRHELKIVDAIFTPSRSVQAGQALLSIVRVENLGKKDEKNIKVTAALPELDVSASDFINKIESGDEKETEELYLRIPKCAEPGTYDIILGVQYNDGFSRTGVQGRIEVLENPSCEKAQQATELQLPPQNTQPANATVDAVPRTGKLKETLETVLLALIALLVVTGLIIGFTRLGSA